jgi:hypothetical protein
MRLKGEIEKEDDKQTLKLGNSVLLKVETFQ